MPKRGCGIIRESMLYISSICIVSEDVPILWNSNLLALLTDNMSLFMETHVTCQENHLWPLTRFSLVIDIQY